MDKLKNLWFIPETTEAVQNKLVDSIALMATVELCNIEPKQKGRKKADIVKDASPLTIQLNKIKYLLENNIAILNSWKFKFLEKPTYIVAKNLNLTIAAFFDLKLNGGPLDFQNYFIQQLFCSGFEDDLTEKHYRSVFSMTDRIFHVSRKKPISTTATKRFLQFLQVKSAILKTDKGYIVAALKNGNFVLIDHQDLKINQSLLEDFPGNITAIFGNFKGIKWIS
jgi:hypothetical protein